ncbi:DUF1214 domain-containing protein [Luteitalea sp. TBR-22]|uniref:DUF1214 domain-containing protein n=1 Tax=Luteitalea sp. TBR-22 TaxID=2802971 RepID=UPI00351D955D
MSGQTLSADGSLVVYLQPGSPGSGKEDNWLPTPRDACFVVMRVFGPEGGILTGKWQQPWSGCRGAPLVSKRSRRRPASSLLPHPRRRRSRPRSTHAEGGVR